MVQVALALFGVAGFLVFVSLAVAQLYSPSTLQLHLELEEKTGTTLLLTLQALSAFSYILCGYYVYIRDHTFRWIAGIAAVTSTVLWCAVLIHHDVKGIQYLCIPLFNLAFYALCSFADKDSNAMLHQINALEADKYDFKKL